MSGRLLAAAVAVSTVVLASPGWAGGAGGFHGGGFRPPAGHPAMGAPRGFGGGGWHGGWRPMPPIAGVIHERPGMRPSYSAYGHTNTGWGGGGFHYGVRGDGARGGGFPSGSGGYAPSGYGHVATGFRNNGFGRYGRVPSRDRWDRERFADGRRPSIYRFGRAHRGYGAGDYGGGGSLYDGSGAYASPGTYGTPGTYGAPGTYGSPGTYGGGLGTQTGYGGAYLSEPPLSATRTEAPLGPSPYGADGGYYAARRWSGRPHILTVDRSSRAGCGCGTPESAYPEIYRYGVGTAY